MPQPRTRGQTLPQAEFLSSWSMRKHTVFLFRCRSILPDHTLTGAFAVKAGGMPVTDYSSIGIHTLDKSYLREVTLLLTWLPL